MVSFVSLALYTLPSQHGHGDFSSYVIFVLLGGLLPRTFTVSYPWVTSLHLSSLHGPMALQISHLCISWSLRGSLVPGGF